MDSAMVIKKLRLFSMPVSNPPRELGRDLAERGREHVLAPDDHIVIARRHVTRGVDAQRLFEAPANAVPFDGISGLFSDREADAWRILVATRQHFEQEQPPAPFLAAADCHELVTLSEPPELDAGWPGDIRQFSSFRQAESRLRPRLRRAATTPRPPLVAMRARKPWRRFRTSFDG